ncbi:MAG TPA: site-specific integrase [Candidatus Scalindua sp.]|nr:site-specific integrase [Candidatus Scalindua sp.]
MENTSTFRILFYIKKTKLLKNGQAPIFMRITTNGERAEISTERSIMKKLWDQKKEIAKGNTPEANKLNEDLAKMRDRIRKIKREMEEEDQVPTAYIISYKYRNKGNSKKTIVNLFTEHNNQCREKVPREMAASTVTRYETALKHLREFMQTKYRVPDYPIQAINHKFIKDFEHYLLTVRGCNRNSTGKYLRNFKTIIRIALSNDWIRKDPFERIKIRMEEVERDFLTEDELNVLIRKEFSTERLTKVKDVYLFCCFTGCAYIDAKGLTQDDIVPGTMNKKCLRVKRKKTNKTSLIPLSEIPESIIEKYRDDPHCQIKRKLLPINSNQKQNEYLNEIASICGIEKKLTTHTARHTFATIGLTSGVPIEIVSSWLGHSNISMTRHYAKIVESLSSKEMDKIARRFRSDDDSDEDSIILIPTGS